MKEFLGQSKMRKLLAIPKFLRYTSYSWSYAIDKTITATVYKEFYFHNVDCRIIKNAIIRNYG